MGQYKLLDIQTSIDLYRVSATEPAPSPNSDITCRGTISTGLILNEPLLVYADNSELATACSSLASSSGAFESVAVQSGIWTSLQSPPAGLFI